MKLLLAILLSALAAAASCTASTEASAAFETLAGHTTLRLRELLTSDAAEPDWSYRELVARLAERGAEAQTIAAVQLKSASAGPGRSEGALVVRVGEREFARLSLSGVGSMSRRVLLAPELGLRQLGMRMRVTF